ncbi:MAG: hypothetical protein Q8K36_07010, partial [Alphaproteobacteria bacterium]|nr:hypothetical protein [Alphaproteobacteria bacterium]
MRFNIYTFISTTMIALGANTSETPILLDSLPQPAYVSISHRSFSSTEHYVLCRDENGIARQTKL